MKKKGFTLIELLAVIVILAIIALIATPIVMNVIENSKKGAAERSAENYLRAVETAIASERLEGPITDGEYLVDQNGDLVHKDNTTIKIEVEVNGTLPEKNTVIVIVNGLVDKTKIEIIIGNYTVQDENKDGKLEAEENNGGTDDVSYLCEKTGEASKTVGAQYTCDLNTPEADTTFYVLENIEESENITLIMDRNFTDDEVPSNLPWCTAGEDINWLCQNINSKEANPLKHIQDRFGNNVEVSFPTKDQIASANNGNLSNLPKWLYDYLNGSTNDVSGVYCYHTATPDSESFYMWHVNSNDKELYNGYGVNTTDCGVRPVITISKNQLN